MFSIFLIKLLYFKKNYDINSYMCTFFRQNKILYLLNMFYIPLFSETNMNYCYINYHVVYVYSKTSFQLPPVQNKFQSRQLKEKLERSINSNINEKTAKNFK